MSNFDLRGLLQYVPQFRGRCFLVAFSREIMAGDEWRDATLDIAALQGLGVKLVIAAAAEDFGAMHEQLVRLDLKVAKVDEERGVNVGDIVERGQAAVMTFSGDVLGTELVQVGVSLKASKLIWITGQSLPDGSSHALHAIPVQNPLPDTDQPELMRLAFEACKAGIRRVHLLDGRMGSVILGEVFSNEGVGVMVYSGAYREFAVLTEEDIPELLSLIGRSVFDALLLDRSYEDIAKRIDDYHLLKIDGNVVGSVALHAYPEEGVAEIACLRIKDNHEGLGYGRALVSYAESRAAEMGFARVFALSQSAVNFFKKQVAYEEWSRADLPHERRAALEQSGRESQVFGKTLS